MKMISYFWEMIKLESLINGIALLLLVWFFTKIKCYFSRLPLLFNRYQKISRYKYLLKIKRNRLDERYYLYELQKAQNWFIIFILVLMLNFIWLVNNHILTISIWWFFIFMTPSFIVEIIWLNHLSYIEDLRIYQKNNLEWKKRRQRKARRKNRIRKNENSNLT